jgi:hypothetical protein
MNLIIDKLPYCTFVTKYNSDTNKLEVLRCNKAAISELAPIKSKIINNIEVDDQSLAVKEENIY